MSEMICISPVDGSVIARRQPTSLKELEAKLASASQVQKQWARVSLDERKKYILAFLKEIELINPEVTIELAWQMGRPVRYQGELKSLKDRVGALLDISDEALSDYYPKQESNIARKIKRVPKGVVMSIVPWNYPYLSAVNSVIPALLAGNAVLLKHSEQTLLVGERLEQSFSKAGLPKGLFSNIFLTHEMSDHIIRNGLVDHVSFTGSVGGGRKIAQAAASRFTSVTLELGGKDPAYVRSDANLDQAADSIVDGSFFNSGQCCCGIERVYVHERVYDSFVERMSSLTSDYILGNPLDDQTTLGPMAAKRFADIVRDQVSEAKSKGAINLISADKFAKDTGSDAYVMPHLLVGVDHRMEVMREETFGPVVGVMKVKSDEEAIALMNDSDYGLTASIWTSDEDAAESIGDQLDTGTVFMNRCDYADPYLAWTGVKDTGMGASLSVLGFQSLTRPVSYHFKR